MTEADRESAVSSGADLTVAIKKLSIPVDTVRDACEERGGTALLLCRDNDSKKWGTRWLSRANLQVSVAPDMATALDLVRSNRPDVVVVEAGLTNHENQRLFQVLQEAADVESAIIVLCSGNSDLRLALDADVFDIARKPFDWQIIAKRAQHALQIKNHASAFDEANTALREALDIANIARDRLRSQERFEPVTGLPNKTKFVDLLRRAMMASARDNNRLAVCVIGFTRFRLVVEAMGQEQADRVLTEIGRKIGACLSGINLSSENVGRGLRTAAVGSLDSFRFGVMLTIPDDEYLQLFQQQLLEAVSRPIDVMGQVVYLSACLGVAVYPNDGDDVDQLLQRADNAMRVAQSRGGGFKYHCSETDRAAVRKLKLEHMLHEALDRNELSVVYQPILNVASGKVTAVEALLRWKQADDTYIPPDEFIAVAEESGLMLRTGEYVLEKSCRQFAAWRHDGHALSRICVNVAKAQLMSPDFVATVKRTLAQTKIDANDLELEISERGVLSGNADVLEQLREIKNLGVHLSIDDFGTGDSAIAYLKELPVDTLKIDRSYIAGFADDGKDIAIASAMVALGQRLNLSVIAEGVETGEQLNVLRGFGCDSYQGFLAAEGLPPGAFIEFLKKTNPG